MGAMNDGGEAVGLIEDAFVRFVQEVHAGRAPYAWQRRLVRALAETNRWPDSLSAPTGAGKTMAIDVHVFLNALAGLTAVDGSPVDARLARLRDAAVACDLPRLPRRLVMTVNRRSLVDDQYDAARELADAICRRGAPQDGESALLHDLYRGLVARSGEAATDDASAPCRVVRLRGGEPVDAVVRDWRYHPTACQVICATPDMFASRLLFRGYGTRAAARPVEAGLLGYDTVLVADEAHLNRQMVHTARSVARLERLADDGVAQSVPPLQVVSTTATQSGDVGGVTVGVVEDDFAEDEELKRRLTSPKPVTMVEVPAAEDRDFARRIAEACVDGFRDDAVVGCIVNTVAMAGAVMEQMRRIMREQSKREPGHTKDDFDTMVRGLVGPMRRYDRLQVLGGGSSASGMDGDADPSFRTGLRMRAMQGDVDAVRDSGLRCVVATQTLEVGVDADFSLLVTELPSAGALVQRAGRMNRRGLRQDGRIVVFRHENSAKAPGIYTAEELDDAWQWLSELPEDTGLSAWASVVHPPSSPRLPRAALQRLELWDVENLSHTDEDLGAAMSLPYQAPADITLWLRDDLLSDGEISNGLVVRQLPEVDADAIALLGMARPVADEVFPISSRRQFNEIEQRWLACRKQGSKESPFRLFIVHVDTVRGASVTLWHPDPDTTLGDALGPGDTIVVDASAPLFNDALHIIEPRSGRAVSDVYHRCQDRGVILSPQTAGNEERGKTVASIIDALRDAVQRDGPASGDPSASDGERFGRAGGDGDADPTLFDLIGDESARELVRAIEDANSRFGRIMQDPRYARSFRQQYEDGGPHGVVPVAWSPIPADAIDDDSVPWLFIQLAEDALGDGAALQEIRSPQRQGSADSRAQDNGLVYLDAHGGHQHAVTQRAEQFMAALNLPPQLRQDVARACRHHDDGKKDLRFQELLHYRIRRPDRYEADTYLAKSRYYSPAWEARVRRELNLRGWRHEQRSAAECWAHADELHATDPELVTRLAGTSHGHGRSCFRDDAERLIPRAEVAAELQCEAAAGRIEAIRAAAETLFDRGVWERIVERTSERYGYWGVAYLEAIVRSADVTISREGR